MMKPKFPFLCQVVYQKGNGQKPTALRLMVDFFFHQEGCMLLVQTIQKSSRMLAVGGCQDVKSRVDLLKCW